MYAKLVFPAGTDFTKVARDIVRAIDNSDGAGGSTVAALEFVTAADSSIDDTVASDWSLASGQTLGTGATNVEQDKLMYLQQTHPSTATMTVAIGTAFKDSASGTFTKANDTQYSGVCLWPVSDYGESYEAIWGRLQEDQSPSSTKSTWSRFTGETVHIIAKDKTLTILGVRSNTYPGDSYSSIIAMDSYENRVGRNRAAMAWILGSNSITTDYESDDPSAINEILDITASINPFTNDHHNPLNVHLVDALYDFGSSAEYRFIGSNFGAYYDEMNKAPRSYPTTAQNYYRAYGCKRDTSQSNGCASQFLSYGTNSYEATLAFIGRSYSYWPYGNSAMNVVPGFTSLQDFPTALPKKPDGTATIFMRPVQPIFGQMKAQFDFSTDGGLYHCTGNFDGSIKNDISDGTDEYVGFKLFSTESPVVAGVSFKK